MVSRLAISFLLLSGIFLVKFDHLGNLRAFWSIRFSNDIFFHVLTVTFGEKLVLDLETFFLERPVERM